MRSPAAPPPEAPQDSGPNRIVLRVGVAALIFATCAVLWPFWPWLTLAAWFGALTGPAVDRLARIIKGRRAAAAIATVVLFVCALVPIAVAVAALVEETQTLLMQVMSTTSGRQAVIAIVSPDGEIDRTRLDLRTLISLFRSDGERALALATELFDVTSGLLMGLFIFFTASFFFLVDGRRALGWIEEHTPIAHHHAERFAAAFVETGRGLLIGVGLTALAQATVATIAYAALGIPRAIVLGVLTFIAAIVPLVGTGLVYVPVSAGLALTGRPVEAVIMLAIGLGGISTIDNVLRPILARWGRLEMHFFLVLVSMLGGLVVLGGWGLLLGPLVLRLTIEALRIAKEEELV